MAINTDAKIGVGPTNLQRGKNYSEGFHFVVKNNGKTVADIVGSCHGDEEGISQLNPTVEKAARKAKRVAFEFIPKSKEDVQRYNAHRKVTEPETRKNYLEFYNNNYSHSHDCKYDSPYSNSSEERKKTSLKSGTESLIRKICGETMTEMMNLETPEEHAEAHNYVDLAKETARQQIAQGLLAAEDLALERNDNMTAVQQGDEPSFTRCIKWRKLQDPSRHYHLTKKRNFIHAARAMPLIKKATTDNRALIVTGSAHLFGKNGVVNLLKHDLGLLNKDLGTEYSIERKFPKQSIDLQGIRKLRKLDPYFTCTKPYKLDVSGSNITNAELHSITQDFPNIVELDAAHCSALTDASLASLANLTKLKRLNLGGCYQITDGELSALKSALPQLTISL